MKMPRRANLITGTLFGIAVAILVGVVYFALNIQVIKDWKLTLPAGSIRAGDTIVVASTYTKLRQVVGTSSRTLECQISSGVYLSTPLSKVPANRSPGTTGTGILVTLPGAIQGVTALPDKCHVCVALSYPILPGRSVPYFNCTKDFDLLPVAVADAHPAAIQANLSPIGISSPSSVALSSNNTAPAPANQQDTSHSPGLLQSLGQSIQNATDFLLNVFK